MSGGGMAEIRKIPDSITYHRTAAQQGVINACAELVADMPDVIGCAIVTWDANGYLTYVDQWPHEAHEVGDVVKERINDCLEVDDGSD